MLEHLLEVRGITKAQLAKETGIVRSVLTNVVAGRRTLSKGNAARLARYFRVPLELLIQGE
jgi:plasmid maintenance system antidote protein VapI